MKVLSLMLLFLAVLFNFSFCQMYHRSVLGCSWLTVTWQIVSLGGVWPLTGIAAGQKALAPALCCLSSLWWPNPVFLLPLLSWKNSLTSQLFILIFFWGHFLPMQCEWALTSLRLAAGRPVAGLSLRASLPTISSPSVSVFSWAWANIHLSCQGSPWPACVHSLPVHFPHCLGYVFLGIPRLWLVTQLLCKRRLNKI